MKSKYCFTIFLILLVMFSLTAISAGEDADSYTSADDSFDGNEIRILENVETDWNQTSPNQENLSSEDDECDLSVDISVEKTYNGTKFNRAGSEIPWNITVEAKQGLARNVKVQLNFSSNMEYVSCNKTIGEYDSSTNIWSIGDLSSSQPAVLTILTRLDSDGHFNCTANASTDSMDVNLLNNFASKFAKSGTGNNGSNETQNSDDLKGSKHGPYIKDIIKPGDDRHDKNKTSSGEEKNKTSSGEENDKNSTRKRGPDENSTEEESDGNGGYISSGYRSYTESASSKTLNLLSNVESTSSILGLNDSKVLDWISKTINEVIPPYDYTRIPIMVFLLSLLALAGIAGYDKFKSQKK